MAVMARVLGIPARMVVGFLAPDQVEGTDDEWVYSAHDLHAWPELYFDGFGWVRFEPTPGNISGAVPSYTTGTRVGRRPDDRLEPDGDREQDQEPRRGASPRRAHRPPRTPAATTQDAAFPWLPVGLGLGGAGLLLLLALSPRLLRRRVRERRLAGGPETAWEELRSTVVDLRLFWPGSRSPRETRDRLVQLFGAPGDEFAAERPARGPAINPDAVVAIDRIVRDLELLRYSRAHEAEVGLLRAEVETVTEAVRAGVAPRVRRRADWLPASVLSKKARSRAIADDQTVQHSVGWSGRARGLGACCPGLVRSRRSPCGDATAPPCAP